MGDDALGVFSLSLFFFSPPKRARRCQGLIYANEKKVIVVCKTTTHRDGEQTASKHVAREKIYIYSRTWVRLFVSSFVFHSLYSRSDVCDCVCVCARDTPDVFSLLFICGFCFSYSVVCMIGQKKAVSRYSQEADVTSLT